MGEGFVPEKYQCLRMCECQNYAVEKKVEPKE